MADISTQPREYWCFISYRHADNKEPGRQWASWLHHSLETYEVPADLVGQKNERGDVIPERIYPVFRDEEELPVDSHLSKPIEHALANSKFLVVLCSPRAVESRFVSDEIALFKKLKPQNEDRILAAIVAGEPGGEETGMTEAATSLVPYARRQCFPRPLRFKVAADETFTGEATEPIAADFRLEDGGEGFTTPAAYREHFGAKAKTGEVVGFERRMELMKLKIIAGILGLPVGLLTARDKAFQLEKERRRAKTLRRWLAAVGVLTLLAVMAGVIAWEQRSEAQAQRRTAEEKQSEAERQEGLAKAQVKEASRSNTAIAQQRLAEGKWREAIAYFARAIRYDETNRNAQDALWMTLRYGEVNELRDVSKNLVVSFESDAGDRWATLAPGARAVVHPLIHHAPVFDALFLEDADFAVTATKEEIRLWTISSGTFKVLAAGFAGGITHISASRGGARLCMVADGKNLHVLETKAGKVVGKPMLHEKQIMESEISADGRLVLTADSENAIRIWEVETSELMAGPFVGEAPLTTALLSPESTRFLTSDSNGNIRLRWLKDGADAIKPIKESGPSHAVFTRDGRRILATTFSGEVTLLDSETGAKVEKEISNASSFPPANFVVSPRSVEPKDRFRLWKESESGLSSGESEKMETEANGIVFSPDGKRFLVIRSDSAIQLCDAETGLPIGPVLKHEAPILSARFSHDSARIITASADQTAQVWESDGGAPLQGEIAESLSAAVAGIKLDSVSGRVTTVEPESGSPGRAFDFGANWRFAILPYRREVLRRRVGGDWGSTVRMYHTDPKERFLSLKSMITIREISTKLLEKIHRPSVAKAATIDARHPVMDFALLYARNAEPWNNSVMHIRTLLSLRDVMEKFPVSASAAELRLAARYAMAVYSEPPPKNATPAKVVELEEVSTAKRTIALQLLDRAAQAKDATPEDEETKALRAELQK